MKFKELEKKSKDELLKMKSDLLTDMLKERALIKVGTQPKNIGKYREARRTVAKINMLLAQKE